MIILQAARQGRHVRFLPLLAAVSLAALAVSGCATMRRHEAASTARLLAAAGFQMRPADTPQWIEALKAMPPRKLVTRSQGENFTYSYADPENCHCLYVGGSKEYTEHERLRTQQEIARDIGWPLWW